MTEHSTARTVAPALLADAALVTGFAAIGTATHHGAVTPGAVAETAWPFLLALSVGWLATRAWRAPLAPVRTGIPLWGVTVVGGMLLRVAIGAGTALPFVIVATLTLLVLLVGWRVVSAAAKRRERA